MMPRTVTTHQQLLRALHTLKPKYRKALLKVCSDDEINCICECIYNILLGKIPLEEKIKNKLGKHKHILRRLISKGSNKSRKRIIIQKGGAFLPIILGTILSSLLSSVV